MNRRTFLRTTGVAGVAGLSVAGGCLQPLGNVVGGYGDADEWRHGVGGEIDAVTNGQVFGREPWNEDGARGAVFALDAETGRREWRYGRTGGYTAYTDLVVEDAVYFGSGDDVVGNGQGELYALEFDGSERWTREVGSVYDPPLVHDGVVYAGSNGVVRALDATNGETLWSVDGFGNIPTVPAVTGTVYAVGKGLTGLDPDDGRVQWRYEGDGGDGMTAKVADGVAYVESYDRLAAVADGEELWHVDGPGFTLTVRSGHLFRRVDDPLQALSVGTGDERWQSEPSDLPAGAPIVVHDGVVYCGGDRLSAVDTDDWQVLWRHEVGEGEAVRSIAVDGSGTDDGTGAGDGTGTDKGSGTEDGDGDGDDHISVYAASKTRIVGVGSGGQRRWSGSVDSDVRNLFADGRLFVGTDESVYVLDPSTDTPSTG